MDNAVIFACMKQVTLTVKKAAVLDDLGITSAYVGAKRKDDDAAYERIATVDADEDMLLRFYTEAAAMATHTLKEWMKAAATLDETTHDYTATLEVADGYDDNLTDNANSMLTSYFRHFILAKWYAMTDEDNVKAASEEATAMLEGVVATLYHRKRPTREWDCNC